MKKRRRVECEMVEEKLEVFCPNCHDYEEFKDGKCGWCGFNHIRKLSAKLVGERYCIAPSVFAECSIEISDGLTTLTVSRVRPVGEEDGEVVLGEVEWWVTRTKTVVVEDVVVRSEKRMETLYTTSDFDDLLSFLQRQLEVTEGIEWKEVVEREVRRDHPERWWETITVIERVRKGEVVNREPTKEELLKLLAPIRR
ncbi:MAG: hypothetical protein EJNHJLOP_00069 [Methanophagales virus PBV082]|uniref:Uncharacterized protein n=1 Tax=Methanophagales virus PBV082 TaxID=3071307 RepID=A0AA46TED5_9VIRU|nr:MAG: hypothetical protein QIT52_gp69 [Methanophagales virus PBV082]UYL64958.1 MAG: hypothetical protein EJNHJLOP_00069 [Methanophagales virus PBV082]